jgi:hypothetical protein
MIKGSAAESEKNIGVTIRELCLATHFLADSRYRTDRYVSTAFYVSMM